MADMKSKEEIKEAADAEENEDFDMMSMFDKNIKNAETI